MANSVPSTTTSPDAETIRGLVAEVLKRLQGAGPSSSVPAAVPAQATTAAAGTLLAGRVVSLAMLEKLPRGTRAVAVEKSAVITPSAREYARDKGIAIERVGAAAQPASGPFLVARAECVADVSARAASLARAVPGGFQVPTTGLADVIETLAMHASRDGARGVLLTGKPAMATVLANRSASLRAVTARDAATLSAAAAEVAANLIIVDPATFPVAMLERLATDLATRPAPVTPAALAARPAGCGCKGH